MSFSIDTNVALRLLVRDIENQYLKAKQLIEGASKPVLVADMVFTELEYALSAHYQMSRKDIVETLTSFMAHPKIDANSKLLLNIFDEYAVRPALSFTDIYLVVLAVLNNKKPLYTFDKKLASQQDDAKLL